MHLAATRPFHCFSGSSEHNRGLEYIFSQCFSHWRSTAHWGNFMSSLNFLCAALYRPACKFSMPPIACRSSLRGSRKWNFIFPIPDDWYFENTLWAVLSILFKLAQTNWKSSFVHPDLSFFWILNPTNWHKKKNLSNGATTNSIQSIGYSSYTLRYYFNGVEIRCLQHFDCSDIVKNPVSLFPPPPSEKCNSKPYPGENFSGTWRNLLIASQTVLLIWLNVSATPAPVAVVPLVWSLKSEARHVLRSLESPSKGNA